MGPLLCSNGHSETSVRVNVIASLKERDFSARVRVREDYRRRHPASPIPFRIPAAIEQQFERQPLFGHPRPFRAFHELLLALPNCELWQLRRLPLSSSVRPPFSPADHAYVDYLALDRSAMRPPTSGMETPMRTCRTSSSEANATSAPSGAFLSDELFIAGRRAAQKILMRCPSPFTCIPPSRRW